MAMPHGMLIKECQGAYDDLIGSIALGVIKWGVSSTGDSIVVTYFTGNGLELEFIEAKIVSQKKASSPQELMNGRFWNG